MLFFSIQTVVDMIVNSGAKIYMLIKEPRFLRHWLNSSVLLRAKYRNIRQQLQKLVPDVFGYLAHPVYSCLLCKLAQSNKVTILNIIFAQKKQVLINPIVMLGVSYWMLSRYFRLHKQRSQHTMLDDKPPDKFYIDNLSVLLRAT